MKHQIEPFDSSSSFLSLNSVAEVKMKVYTPVQPDSQSGVDKRRESWHHGQWSHLPLLVHLHTDEIT